MTYITKVNVSCDFIIITMWTMLNYPTCVLLMCQDLILSYLPNINVKMIRRQVGIVALNSMRNAFVGH